MLDRVENKVLKAPKVHRENKDFQAFTQGVNYKTINV